METCGHGLTKEGLSASACWTETSFAWRKDSQNRRTRIHVYDRLYLRGRALLVEGVQGNIIYSAKKACIHGVLSPAIVSSERDASMPNSVHVPILT